MVTQIFGGHGVIGTVMLHVPVQPFRLMLSVRVNDPDAPAVTVTVGPLAEPLIEPLPVIDQEWITVPPVVDTVEV